MFLRARGTQLNAEPTFRLYQPLACLPVSALHLSRSLQPRKALVLTSRTISPPREKCQRKSGAMCRWPPTEPIGESVGWKLGALCRAREQYRALPRSLSGQCLCLGGSPAMLLVPQPLNPPRTYQEHEDDGALVDVVHQVTRFLAKPAPAKTGQLRWPAG